MKPDLQTFDQALLFRAGLSVVILVMFGLGAAFDVGTPWRDTLAALATMVAMWWFGSSKGSSDKTAALANGKS